MRLSTLPPLAPAERSPSSSDATCQCNRQGRSSELDADPSFRQPRRRRRRVRRWRKHQCSGSCAQTNRPWLQQALLPRRATRQRLRPGQVWGARTSKLRRHPRWPSSEVDWLARKGVTAITRRSCPPKSLRRLEGVGPPCRCDRHRTPPGGDASRPSCQSTAATLRTCAAAGR